MDKDEPDNEHLDDMAIVDLVLRASVDGEVKMKTMIKLVNHRQRSIRRRCLEYSWRVSYVYVIQINTVKIFSLLQSRNRDGKKEKKVYPNKITKFMILYSSLI